MLPALVDLDDYAGIIIHCTASYHPDNVVSLDKQLARPFEFYDGIKILMKQDEQLLANRFARFIGEKKFDLVITCVSREEQPAVYPRCLVGEAEFVQVFTGYVSPLMRNLKVPEIGRRPLDITYRGSVQPLSFGRLGFEKRKIGYDVARTAVDHPLKIDISSRRADRIGGTAWFDFLASSKAVLGAESGTNLFDFSGEVEAWCRQFELTRADADRLSEAFYQLAHDEYLHQFEGNVNYAQISPRHLEAAATRSVQVLYEGSYSGVLVANRHFIPLRRDLANFDDVVDFISDSERCTEMAACAFEEIVLNQRFHYETFVEKIDRAIDQMRLRKSDGKPSARRAARHVIAPRALVLAGHEPTLDPRIDWMAEGLTADFDVCELGLQPSQDRREVAFERLSDRRVRVRIDHNRHDWDMVPNIPAQQQPGASGLHNLILLHVLGELPARALARSIGALDATEDDLARFRWFTRHYATTNCALLRAARLLGDFDMIIAADMGTLPAAVALAEEYRAKLLYDAHEFWPWSQMEFRHWELEFWSAFDRDLARQADLRVTVSPQLADIMTREYGCEFLTVPNCTMRSSANAVDLEAALENFAQREEILFIFLGGFNNGRGIEDLITAWQYVGAPCRLLLQGPDNPFKSEMIELARGYKLLDKSVLFPAPVNSSDLDLVAAARRGDVGIIPYAASTINNRYCSPNKLSQYMAAGLPIVCNELDFVKQVVTQAGVGFSVDFEDHRKLAAAINELAADKAKIVEMSRRSRRYFDTTYHWESMSREMYANLRSLRAAPTESDREQLDFSWLRREYPRSAAEAVLERTQPSSDLMALQPASPVSELLSAVPAVDLAATMTKQYVAHLEEINQRYKLEIERLN